MSKLEKNIRIIDSAGDVFRWFIERMEASERRASISPELNALCDRFIELLIAGDAITVVPVTRNAILRDANLEAGGGRVYVERSAEIVDLLKSIGHRLEKSQDARSVPFDDLVVCVAKTCRSSVVPSVVVKTTSGFHVIAARSAVTDHSVYFDVECRPAHDSRWLSRFMTGTN